MVTVGVQPLKRPGAEGCERPLAAATAPVPGAAARGAQLPGARRLRGSEGGRHAEGDGGGHQWGYLMDLGMHKTHKLYKYMYIYIYVYTNMI